MLPRLVEYERRMAAEDLQEDQFPPNYRRRPVMGVINLEASGSCWNPVTLVEKKGGRRVSLEVAVPDDPRRTRNADFRPLLLADKAEFVLGVPPADSTKRSRTLGRHQRFVELVRKCAERTGEPQVAAVLRFLQAGQWRGRDLPPLN